MPETSKENRWKFRWNGLTSSATTLAAVFLGAWLTNHYGLQSQLKIASIQKKQEVIGRLTGERYLRAQLYVSRFEALIYSDYHERRWKLAGAPRASLDLDESMRWMHKSEDLGIEVARCNESFFETIGLVRAVFPPSAELENRVRRLTSFKAPAIVRGAENLNFDELNTWKQKAVADLQKLVEQEYSQPTDELLDFLTQQVSRELQ